MSCRPLRCPPNSVLAAEAPPDAFGIAIGRHATVDSIISVTRLIPCAGAQYVTPAEKNMLLCEAAANGKLMKVLVFVLARNKLYPMFAGVLQPSATSFGIR